MRLATTSIRIGLLSVFFVVLIQLDIATCRSVPLTDEDTELSRPSLDDVSSSSKGRKSEVEDFVVAPAADDIIIIVSAEDDSPAQAGDLKRIKRNKTRIRYHKKIIIRGGFGLDN
ncbi:hypothetical protein Fcan01_08670 [Folsomia candida]|uniref:Uncharacterized protein n=1 Tax=Folsomia candida TaxID=158441 RepID=A0A226EIV3_FOLCA|nr:hypothetical protein Fcan01_08670 [Folsomia candida]